MASPFVFTWHASMINELLCQVEVPSGQRAAARRRSRWSLRLRFDLTAAQTVSNMFYFYVEKKENFITDKMTGETEKLKCSIDM